LAVSAFAVISPVYDEWEKWKNEYKPNYLTSEEHAKRFMVFAQNRHRVLELNKKYADQPDGPRFALNKFADLSPEEFASRYLHEIQTDIPRGQSAPASNKDYPKKKDWRDEGAVGPVWNQGMCSVWPYASIDSMEGAYKAAHNIFPKLSIQQLIDCDHDCSMYMGQKRCNQGCTGGLPTNAFSYAVREGITTEDEYPQPGNGTCHYTHSGTVYKFKSWFQVDKDEDKMVAAINDQGPITVGVDAEAWQFYSSGIFNANCGTTINHVALIVGYDSVVTDKEVKFWIIKNTWGDVWGENGYIRLIRGSNKCAVNDFVNAIVA